MPADEIHRELLRHIRTEAAAQCLPPAIAQEDGIPVAALDVLDEFDGLLDLLALHGVPIARQVRPLHLVGIDAARPHELLVEAMPREHVRLVVEIIDLPFSGDRRGVARLAKEPRKKNLPLRIESAAAVKRSIVMEPEAGGVRIAAGEQHGAARAADRRRITVLGQHAGAREPVDVRRAVLLAAVRAEPFAAEIIEQDDDDVGAGGRGGSGGGGEAREENQQRSDAESQGLLCVHDAECSHSRRHVEWTAQRGQRLMTAS